MRPREWVAVGVDGRRNARNWAADYLYCGTQLAGGVVSFVSREDPAHWRGVDGDRLPVVLLPGIYETWRMMRPLAHALREAGHPVWVVRAVKLNSRSVIAETRAVVDFVRHYPELEEFAIVAHSKGGLVGKSVMLVPDIGERVRVMVTVATPFAGSSFAALAVPGLGIRSLRPQAGHLGLLAANAHVNSRIVSLIPRWDPHIPDSCEVAGGTNVHLAETGHFAPLGSPEVHRLVVRALDDAARAPADDGGRTGGAPVPLVAGAGRR